jgi:fatty acid desaturase
MAAAARARPEDHFNAEEWRSLSERSTWRGLWLVAHCWGVIAIAMLMGTIWPLTIPFAVMIIGTRQLGLFVLMHDAAHATLHVNRRVNDWVGTWLCSAGLRQYRPYHLQHHRFVQQTEDPDLVLSAPFPISQASLARKVLRDLSGQTFYKQHFGHIAPAIRARANGESALQRFRLELAKDKRFLLSHALGFMVFAAAGGWWIWLTLWLLPTVCWLPLAVRIRNIAEHALVGKNQADPLRQARTTQANWLERTLIAPYWVNYHCEHHLFTNLPCWKLPVAHAILRQRGTTANMEIQPSYLTLLRLATARTTHHATLT